MKRNELSLHRKEQMAASLKKLMTRKNLGRITIQELADETGMTLYEIKEAVQFSGDSIEDIDTSGTQL